MRREICHAIREGNRCVSTALRRLREDLKIVYPWSKEARKNRLEKTMITKHQTGSLNKAS